MIFTFFILPKTTQMLPPWIFFKHLKNIPNNKVFIYISIRVEYYSLEQLIPFVIFSNLQTLPNSKFISEKKVEFFFSELIFFCSIKIIRNGKINLEKNLKEKKIYVKNFEKKKRKKEKIADCTFRNLEVYSLSCNVTLGLLKLHWPNWGHWESSHSKERQSTGLYIVVRPLDILLTRGPS